mmetsp:Transcript_9401/g.13771  ORF Transcript_9401/g.13771 Transcript_9401/m.13771 type:complete len:82 (-) Transcript_9401:342-587(-)
MFTYRCGTCKALCASYQHSENQPSPSQRLRTKLALKGVAQSSLLPTGSLMGGRRGTLAFSLVEAGVESHHRATVERVDLEL